MVLSIELGRHCNFTCSHCANNSGPDNLKYDIDESDIQSITTFIKTNKIGTISFVGGEPTLYINRMNSIIQEIEEQSNPQVQIVTNGWFANSIKKTEEILGQIRRLDRVVVSLDKFHHQSFATIENRVKNLQIFCNNTITLIVEAVIDSLMDLTTISQRLATTGVKVQYQHLSSLGRARTNKLQFKYPAFQKNTLDQRCPQLGSVAYYPKRGFSFCCSSLALGDSNEFEGIFFESYEALSKSPILRLLKSGTFKEIIAAEGISSPNFEPGDSDVCQTCEKIMKTIFLSSNIQSLAMAEISKRTEGQSIVRLDISSFTDTEIDKYRLENMSDPTFAGFIFRREKIESSCETLEKLTVVNDVEEKEELYLKTLREAHSDRMRYLSKDEQAKNEAEHPKLVKSGTMYKYTSQAGEVLGLIFLMNTIYLNEDVVLLAWVWKSKDASKVEAADFRLQVKMLLDQSPKTVISSIEKQNTRSIDFHRKMGFKAKWLMFRFQ